MGSMTRSPGLQSAPPLASSVRAWTTACAQTGFIRRERAKSSPGRRNRLSGGRSHLLTTHRCGIGSQRRGAHRSTSDIGGNGFPSGCAPMDRSGYWTATWLSRGSRRGLMLGHQEKIPVGSARTMRWHMPACMGDMNTWPTANRECTRVWCPCHQMSTTWTR